MQVEPEEIYLAWAPPGALWSNWVAPALFVQIACPQTDEGDKGDEKADVSWFPSGLPERTAIILDLPGAKSIRRAVQLAVARGFRPVPVINASPGPSGLQPDASDLSIIAAQPSAWDVCVVDMRELISAVCAATPTVKALQLATDAPPAFILDDARVHGNRPANEGMFDNRWMVFPQDFPSAAVLQRHGIRNVLLLQEDNRQPREDLAHVLLRWQQAGIGVYGPDGTEMRVQRPSQFRAVWYRALAIAGLRRNSAGGFGSYIPESGSAG
jgi:hypothetical protein